eukprot:TRINITY_DN27392_c0_g1_i1.p1 TRINITY_DN27392_c0_g1~~TRINITY_DN27392_c0_g1_i1.p1  ORF type:complete len:278 (-),score=34.98 TRINITY_DN27392_c0_g1_i1:32-844(-)
MHLAEGAHLFSNAAALRGEPVTKPNGNLVNSKAEQTKPVDIARAVQLFEDWLGKQVPGVTLQFLGDLTTMQDDAHKQLQLLGMNSTAVFSLKGLTHRASEPEHAGFTLGTWVPQGEAGIAWHGTDVDAFASILRNAGRIEKGPEGDPRGVYHSEIVAVATAYMRSTGVCLECISFVGVLLKLRVTGLVMYSAERDPISGRHLVPGPRTARWNNEGRPQSCSEPEQVEIIRAYVEFRHDESAQSCLEPATLSAHHKVEPGSSSLNDAPSVT